MAINIDIHPFITYAAKQLNPLWIWHKVGGSRYAVSDKGWVDRELFLKMLCHDAPF